MTTVEDTRKLSSPSLSVADSYTEDLYDVTTDTSVQTRSLFSQILTELRIMNLYFSDITGNTFTEEDV